MGALPRPLPPSVRPPICGSRLAELGCLPFTSSVQDFADRFQTLACHAPGVTARQRADLFVGGLPDHIRIDMEMRDPQDLQTAVDEDITTELLPPSLQDEDDAAMKLKSNEVRIGPMTRARTKMEQASHEEKRSSWT
ncbi:hypothetical protein QYE76_048897 [Lolium multiflorum]|uniref:Uncharacterized protein n=1 Tax=Lolium multiflorum TaxID=4521 RepID=A0AAD8SP08_LOLMU|nr:hypothetical protein QYE76_048897 [Lolium multiflorum]